MKTALDCILWRTYALFHCLMSSIIPFRLIQPSLFAAMEMTNVAMHSIDLHLGIELYGRRVILSS